MLVLGYTWLGACWLYWRTVDELQRRSARQARGLAVLTILGLVVLVIWSATLHVQYAQRLSDPRVWIPAAALLGVCLLVFFCGFAWRFDFVPLFAALGIFVLAFALMLIALYPLIIPPNLTMQAATSSPKSQLFMLIDFAVLIPVTLVYNTFGFRVFSGKVRVRGEGGPR